MCVNLVSVLVAQSCLTLCDPVDSSSPGSSVHGVLQARILEWVVMAFSRDLPNPGIEPRSPTLQAHSLPSEAPGKPGSVLFWLGLTEHPFYFSAECRVTSCPGSPGLRDFLGCWTSGTKSGQSYGNQGGYMLGCLDCVSLLQA